MCCTTRAAELTETTKPDIITDVSCSILRIVVFPQIAIASLSVERTLLVMLFEYIDTHPHEQNGILMEFTTYSSILRNCNFDRNVTMNQTLLKAAVNSYPSLAFYLSRLE